MQGPTTTAQAPSALAEDRLLRPEQAAWYLNVKTSWVYDAVRAGRLPCHRVGRHIRFTRHMLDDSLTEQASSRRRDSRSSGLVVGIVAGLEFSCLLCEFPQLQFEGFGGSLDEAVAGVISGVLDARYACLVGADRER
jgi:excisionase family DNA binding protein